MPAFTEFTVEEATLEWFQSLDYLFHRLFALIWLLLHPKS
jgi:hypothetical protein